MRGLTWAGTVRRRRRTSTWIPRYGRRHGNTASRLCQVSVGKRRVVVRHRKLLSFFCLHRRQSAACRRAPAASPSMGWIPVVWRLTNWLIIFVTKASMVSSRNTNCWRKKTLEGLLRLPGVSLLLFVKYVMLFHSGKFAVRWVGISNMHIDICEWIRHLCFWRGLQCTLFDNYR